ncbi:MAG: inositol monophosphatase [Opitutales bacterium]
MEKTLDERIERGREAVTDQAKVLEDDFGNVASQWKEDGTRVTQTDLQVSRDIFSKLESSFPDDDYFSEEMDPGQGVLKRKGEFSWILDPVDGTNNFAIGIPTCGISLALLREGIPIYGFIYDFARKQVIEGGPGFGVRAGGTPVNVNPSLPSPTSLIALQAPEDPAKVPAVTKILSRYKIRALGSSALHIGYVAAGRINGVIDHNVRIWDIAAGYALCLGAGGEVHFLNGAVFPLESFDMHMPKIHYLAGNPAICAELLELLR